MGQAERQALADALAWQIELGADEAIGEAPVDRFAEAAPPAAPKPAPAEARPAAPLSEVAAPADLAARAADLEGLAAVMRDWEGSELKKGARNFVFADGRPGAPLMVIGEAPGGDEDRIGKPFVGRAGQLLDKMLAAIGVDRAAEDLSEAAYIANILPWRPPGNRTPSAAEVEVFLPFIIRHIELARPRVIFSIGNTPTKALLGTATGIRRMRGRWVRHEATGLPLLPSFHPAYLLRQPAEKRHAWHDLLALKAVLDGAGPPC